jgi:hypothetical protein
MKTQLTAAALGLALLAPPIAAAEHERTEVISREIVLGSGVREVVVDNVFGSVVVRAGEPGTVSLTIRQRARSRHAEALEEAFEEVTLRVDEGAARLELVQDGPFRCQCQGRCGGCHWDPDYEVSWDWEVRVPPSIDLEASTVNGGSLEVEGVGGRVEASNVNGPLRLAGLSGEVAASTVNGDLIAAFTSGPGADASFTTVNGDVELELPESASAELGFDTMNGEIFTDFEFSTVPRRATPVNDSPGEARRPRRYRLDPDLVVRIGERDGGPHIDCETLNGDIVVRAR